MSKEKFELQEKIIQIEIKYGFLELGIKRRHDIE